MSRAVAIDLDASLADTRALWRAFLADVARRFAAIARLDPSALPEDRGAAAAELDRWASAGVGDWRKALERFAEDHAAIYVRPDPDANAAVRALAATGHRIGVFSDAPEPLARLALAHAGVSRSVDVLETGDGALARLHARLGGSARVVSDAAALRALAAELPAAARNR